MLISLISMTVDGNYQIPIPIVLNYNAPYHYMIKYVIN